MTLHDKAKELLDGLEGVTPGPYAITTCLDYWVEAGGKGIAHCGDIHWLEASETINDQAVMEVNARHFSRCSPDSLRPILERFLEQEQRIERLEKALDAGIELYASVSPAARPYVYQEWVEARRAHTRSAE